MLKFNRFLKGGFLRNIARSYSVSKFIAHQDLSSFSSSPSINVRWKDKNGEINSTEAKVGMTLLNVAHANDIALEGACEGVCACSTCHVILEDEVYEALPIPSEDEEDMLDQAFGLTSTSRLGCQVTLEQKHDNLLVTLPIATRNFYVDGHVPKPH
mmetsp:Transcript_3637/g.3754  ORF Transcript_3637/g.3754 Transcript_3637/m.3754 type:complete len:156 (+) Transcript_3637:143-610(+)